MKRKSENGNLLFKAGLFIIFTLVLLIFSIFWLRFFSFTHDKEITASFLECSPISRGIPVYYNGVNIGKINDVDFSDDFKRTLIKIYIYKKNLNLPNNVYAEIKTEGITGGKYLAILYPDNPSKEILKNGDVIEGKLSAFYEITKAIDVAIKSKQFSELFEKINKTAANTDEYSKKMIQLLKLIEEVIYSNKNDFQKLISESALSASNVNVASNSIKKLSVSPELNQNIKLTVSNISKSSEKLDKITADIDKITGDYRFQQGLIKTADSTGSFMESLNQGELNCLIKKTFENTNKTLNKYNCIGHNFSCMMNQKFLLFKLMFANPGENFEKCTDLQCMEQEFSNQCPYQTNFYPKQ